MKIGGSCYTMEYWLTVRQNEASPQETYPRWLRDAISLDIQRKELGHGDHRPQKSLQTSHSGHRLAESS